MTSAVEESLKRDDMAVREERRVWLFARRRFWWFIESPTVVFPVIVDIGQNWVY